VSQEEDGDKSEKMGAVALAVNVGYFSDPEVDSN
jgi:hypothetical protein